MARAITRRSPASTPSTTVPSSAARSSVTAISAPTAWARSALTSREVSSISRVSDSPKIAAQR